METNKNDEPNHINQQQNGISDDFEEEEEDVWQDLVGIAADPPDRREKCEYCL